jgi:hypothetical protein
MLFKVYFFTVKILAEREEILLQDFQPNVV